MKTFKRLLSGLILGFCAGCTLASPLEPPPTPSPGPIALTPAPTLPPVPTVPPTATPPPFPWTDEIPTMYGVCFEFAEQQVGTPTVIRSGAEHTAYYERADAACGRPVQRVPFDFGDDERVLAGIWSAGTGCTADHEVIDHSISEGTLAITLRFITEGDCNYELLRPFWVGAAGVNDVTITVAP